MSEFPEPYASALYRLAEHQIENWALTGGLAIGIYIAQAGCDAQPRALSDLDFVVANFEDIPETLGKEYLFRHVHPDDPPGKTMMQMVDAEAKLRIDIFRAGAATLKRARRFGKIRIVALEDLIARTARLSLDVAGNVSTPAKHAQDFLRLSKLIEPEQVQAAWLDHRKQEHPHGFKDVLAILQELIPKRSGLLITPTYAANDGERCLRCKQTKAFPLADPKNILEILGYC